MKKLFKITGIVLVIIATLLLVLYVYIINHAENILHDIVASQSNGKLSLEMKKLKFKPGTLHLEVIEPHFYTNDTLTAFTGYDISASSLVLELSALRPLIFKRKIILDSIVCMRPQVIVTKWKDQPEEKFSLPEQMGKAYSELEKALQNLNIKYCLIDSGSFTIVNKLSKDIKPISITNYRLRINNLMPDSASGADNRYLFTDRITFSSAHQDIIVPGGNHGIKYSKLRINSLTRSMELDSCYIYGKKSGSGFNEFGVYFDTLRITGADLKKMTRFGIIKADSALCINPQIRINAEVTEKSNSKFIQKPRLSRDSMEMVIKTLLADIDIHYIGVQNASVNIKTKSRDKISTFSSKRSNFSMEDIIILSDPAIPIKFGSLSMGVYGYQTYDPDSTYLVSFDSILFKNFSIRLSNFAITPTLKNENFTNRKTISMRTLEIKQLSWLNLLLNKKIVADEIAMIIPEVSIIAPGKKSTSKSKRGSLYETFRSMDHLIDVGRLKIVDANIDLYAGENSHLRLVKVNADIDVGEFLHSNNINEMKGAVNKISFAGGKLNSGDKNILLQEGLFNGFDQSLSIGRTSLTVAGGGSFAVIEDIRVGRFLNEGGNQFDFQNLSWRKANIEIHPSYKNNENGKETANEKKDFQLALKLLDGKNTSISFQSANIAASVNIDRLQTNGIDWDGNNDPVVRDLRIRGTSLRLKKSALDLTAGDFMIVDRQSSFFHQLKIFSAGIKDTISIVGPNLTFTPNIVSLLKGAPIIQHVVLKDPEISLYGSGDTAKTQPNQNPVKLPKLEINQVVMVNPIIARLPASLKGTIDISNQKSNWVLAGIKSDGEQLKIASLKSVISTLSVETNKLSLSVTGNGKLAADFSGISYSPARAEFPAAWAVNLDSIVARNISFVTKRNDTIKNQVLLQSLDIENLGLNSSEKSVLKGLLAKTKQFRVKNGNVSLVSAKTDLRVKNFAYNNIEKRLSFDSFSVKPVMDRDSFYRIHNWAKDYIEFSTGKTVMDGIDPELLLNDSVFFVRKIESAWPVLEVYKDKRLPIRVATYRDLPASRLQHLSNKIKIDSVYLLNADINYKEVNDKTRLTGTVQFKRTNILLEGIKTFDYGPTDSLRLKAISSFMNSTTLRLRFSESYQDTLHGFLMHLRLSPFYMTALNPILEPLVSLKIKTGWMDTLHMSGIGNQYLSLGKMRMYYSGLKAQYLQKGDEHVKTVKTRLINFTANRLILKRQNQQGFGKVYSERKQEKSILNYWIKMVVSGAISSTGVRSNKKQEKRYYKSINKLKVPEIPDVAL